MRECGHSVEVSFEGWICSRFREGGVPMKNMVWLIGALLLVGITAFWLFFPSTFSWCNTIWVAIGRPGVPGRLGYLAAFWAMVFFLAVRLGKSGP